MEEEKFDCTVAKNYMPEVVELNVVKEIVKDLASEHNNGWISVEDALPEEYMDVLGYGQEGHTYLVRLNESKIFGNSEQHMETADNEQI